MSIAPTLFPEIEGPEFIEGPTLAAVAEEVLRRHGAAGGIGRLFDVRRAIHDQLLRVLYLINTKPFNPLQDDITHDAIAKTVKAPRLWHDVTGYDAVIWARSYFWDQFDDNQQAAVALHELLHLDVQYDDDGQPKLRLRKHDVEDFDEVVRYYGAFLPSRATFFKAFGLWEADGGRPAPATPAPGGITSITVSARRPGVEPRTVTIDAAAVKRIRQDLAKRKVNLGACPWPGCELAGAHPGAHQTAVDDTPEPEGGAS